MTCWFVLLTTLQKYSFQSSRYAGVSVYLVSVSVLAVSVPFPSVSVCFGKCPWRATCARRWVCKNMNFSRDALNASPMPCRLSCLWETQASRLYRCRTRVAAGPTRCRAAASSGCRWWPGLNLAFQPLWQVQESVQRAIASRRGLWQAVAKTTNTSNNPMVFHSFRIWNQSSTRNTATCLRPLAPMTKVCSMSEQRLGPVMMLIRLSPPSR